MLLFVFRADATTSLGAGHIMRCLALAQKCIESGYEVVFISKCENKSLRTLIEKEKCRFISLKKNSPDQFDEKYTLKTIRDLQYRKAYEKAWLIIDGDQFSSHYMEVMKLAGYYMLIIDDMTIIRRCKADIVLNQNLNAIKFRCHYPDAKKLLLGSKYILLRKEFENWRCWEKKIAPVARRILVTMGGSDPENATYRIIIALSKWVDPKIHFDVIIGRKNKKYNHIVKRLQRIKCESRIFSDVSTISTLMARADIAIIQAGGTLWELLFMGCPIISFSLNTIQEGILAALAKKNILSYQGSMKNIQKKRNTFLSPKKVLTKYNIQNFIFSLSELIHSHERREYFSKAGKKLVDGKGSQRVLKVMEGYSVAV
jgi:UDP-2,4-diacetamido-2,4,6-trideoxy-beta-L-altropyranose hydrolase